MSQEALAMLGGILFASFLIIPGLIGVHLRKREARERRERDGAPTPPAHP